MNYDDSYKRYNHLFESLAAIVQASNARIINEPPDELFSNNVNFFVKAYLITICTYLEAYLQEVASLHYEKINERLVAAKIPHNFLYKNVQGIDFKDKDFKFEYLSFEFGKEKFVNNISGNIDKTIKLFSILGLDIKTSVEFNEIKSIVAAVVNKRNNIIHYNDSAAETSFKDVLIYVENFTKYIKSINDFMLTSDT